MEILKNYCKQSEEILNSISFLYPFINNVLRWINLDQGRIEQKNLDSWSDDLDFYEICRGWREGRFDPARKRDTTFRKNVEEEEEEGREGSAIKFLRKLLFVPAPPLSPSPPYANICPTTENRNTYSRQINTSEQSEQRNGGVGRLPRRTKYGAKVEMELVKRHCQRCVLLPWCSSKQKERKEERKK